MHLIVETLAILICKRIISNLFKNKITYKLFTYKYAYSFKCVQINKLFAVT